MLTAICLWWVGLKLSAPTWYFVLLSILLTISFGQFFAAIYKAGKKAAKDEA